MFWGVNFPKLKKKKENVIYLCKVLLIICETLFCVLNLGCDLSVGASCLQMCTVTCLNFQLTQLNIVFSGAGSSCNFVGHLSGT